MRCFILIASFCLILQPGFAQSNYRFKHFGTQDGLASERVEYIRQDSLGFIWCAYTGGLSRFDGYSFKLYKSDPIDSSSWPGNEWLDRIDTDPEGNLWLLRYGWNAPDGTFSLTRYDKNTDRFTKIKPPLQGAPVFSVTREPDAPVMWLAGGNGFGLFRFNYLTNEVKNFKVSLPDPAIQHLNNCLIYAKNCGKFLLVTTFHGLWRFDKTTETFTRPKVYAADSSLFFSQTFSFFFSSPRTVGPDNNKEHWVFMGRHKVGTETYGSQMIRLDSNLRVTGRLKFPPEFQIESLDRDRDGVFWIISKDELLRYDPKDGSTEHIRHQVGDPYSLPDAVLIDNMVDKDQNVWLATSKGISMMKKQGLEFYNYEITKSPAIETYEKNGKDFLVVPKSIPEKDQSESTNEIHVAAIVHSKLDSVVFQKVPLKQPNARPAQLDDKTWIGLPGEVYDFAAGQDRLWISTTPSGVTGLTYNKVTGMIEGNDAVQMHHNPKNANTIGTDMVLGIMEKEGNLWVSTNGSGISKVALNLPYGSEGSVTRYTHEPQDSNSIASNIVYRFFPHEEKSIWVNTSSGIDLYHGEHFEHVDRKTGQVYAILKAANGTTYLGTTDGLYSSPPGRKRYKFERDPAIKDYEALGVSEDSLGRLWLSNLQGVAVYDPKEKTFIEFGEEDGVGHSYENMERTSKGVFVVTDQSGITLFDPMTLKVCREKADPVLTRLLVNNRAPVAGSHKGGKDDFRIPLDIPMLKELVIDFRHNNFSIEFASMHLTDPTRDRYRYKLEGYDPDWVQTTWKSRMATYTNLNAGTYTFRVQASNHHGIWSDSERRLAIVVLPPPWKTWWAYTGYSLLAVGFLLMARRSIVQRERLKSNFKLEHLELEKAKEVDRVKTSFFTNISHEFRTPLTLIKGPVQNMIEQFVNGQKEFDRQKIVDQLKLVQRNSDHLLKLINQLLDLARLEAGSLKVEKSEADLFSFIRAVASSFESFARQKNVTLSLQVPTTAQPALFDKDKLETILINIINNAVKFTPPGGQVAVSGTWQVTAEAQRRKGILTLSVADTGIGIPVDQQSRIFERFHQVSESHKEVGTGIGLSLVRELVALMEGQISVKSESGAGSVFTVTLPLEMEPEPYAAESSTLGVPREQREARSQRPVIGISNVEHPILNDEVDSAKPHVLVVEDNSDLRSFIIDSLGNEFSFLEAENGLKGLEIATAEVPDLIISDVMMPEMDGITMAGKIKKDIRSSHIPLILLTAKSSEDSMLSGLQSGADDYLTKPFNKNELLLKVRNRIEAQAKIRERIKLELLSEGPKVEVQSADEQFLQKVKDSILSRLGDEQLSVESLADEIGLSRSQLFRKIVALTGVSANELIRKFRLQKAAQLLQQNWGPVSQIAYEVGFSNLSYFSKVFKEEFGVLPSEYEKA